MWIFILQDLSNTQQTSISSLILDIQALRTEENRLKKVQEDLLQKNIKLEELLLKSEANLSKVIQDLTTKDSLFQTLKNEADIKMKELIVTHNTKLKELEEKISIELREKQILLQEKDTLLRELEDKSDIKSLLEKEAEKLKAAELEYSERVTRINISHTDEVIRLKAEIKSKEELLQHELSKSLAEKKKSEEVENTLRSELDHLQYQISAEQQSYGDLQLQLEEERKQAIEREANEINKLRQESELKLRQREDELRAVFLSQLEKHKKIAAEEVSSIKETHISGILLLLGINFKALRSQVKALEERSIELQKKLSEQMNSRLELETKLSEEKENLKHQHERDVESLNQSFANTLEQEKQKHRKEIEVITLDYEKKLQDQNSFALLSKYELEDNILKLKNTHDLTLSKLQASMESLKQDHLTALSAKQKENETMKQDHSNEIRELKNSMDYLKQQLQSRDHLIHNSKQETTDLQTSIQALNQELQQSQQVLFLLFFSNGSRKL